ncbi:hypothetical protein [Nocardioides gilvus]|uniref:hypothetical protein n=1 Tax=Nocardioides gilvus TaxID=1735589 RepID=UPI000D7508CC|nr:hypothetical protein [Nocardioides gilvus]
MAVDPGPGDKTFGRRLERWTRDAAELRSRIASAGGLVRTPEETALRRYQRSTTSEVALPHPSVSPRRYAALNQRHRELSTQLGLAVLLAPVLLIVGVAVGPLAAQFAIWALLLPVVALAAHRGRALRQLDAERHLALRGGLADAWRDWLAARDKVEALDGASQARAAIAANDLRMQALVVALGRADGVPGHQDTKEHAASREWVFRSAAKASALAEAERELEAATQRQVDAGELQFAPDGDLDELDQALEAARQLRREMDPPTAPSRLEGP